MVRFLGWFNVFLLVLLVSLYLVKRFGRWKGKSSKGAFKILLKGLRKVHRPLGAVVLTIGLIHGYWAFGGRWNVNSNGFLLWLVLLVVALLGGIFAMQKHQIAYKLHKFFALIAVLALVLHLMGAGPLFT